MIDAGKAVAAPERVKSQNFGVMEFKRNRWFYELSEAQTKEDLLRPEFWADVVDKVRGHQLNKGTGDRIEFDKPDTGWAATARISAIGQGYMKINMFEECKPEALADLPKNCPMGLRWNPGKKVHEVIRKSSSELMATGFQQKAEAIAWINDHVKAMAA